MRNGVSGYDRMNMERSSDAMRGTSRERVRSSPTNLSMENIDLANHGPRSSFGRDSTTDESDLPGVLMFGSVDFSGQNIDFSNEPHSPKEPSARHSAVSAIWYSIVNASN